MNGNLKALRQRRALSLADLSKISKVGRVTINRVENGKQRPRPRTIRALAKALQVNVEELTTEQSKLL
jgi:transcriptional regulator with XRE-family HTH domain